jgi:hypothetical protein
MLIIIRNEEKLSPKANFIVRLLSQNLNINMFYVFKRENEKFREKWRYDQVQLPSSTMGLITYYSLMMLKSPRDSRNGLMVRLSLMKPKHTFAHAISTFWHFSSSQQANSLAEQTELAEGFSDRRVSKPKLP